MPSQPAADTPDDQSWRDVLFDFSRIREFLLFSRYLLLAGAVAGLVGAMLFSALVPRVYQVTMVVGPAERDSQNTTFSGGGPTSLFTAATTNKLTPFGRFLYALKSLGLAEKIDAQYGARKIAFSDRWNGATRQWTTAHGLFGDGEGEPSTRELTGYINSRLTIATDDLTGMTTIGFNDRDPAKAARMLSMISAGADDIVRQADRARAIMYRSYLQEQLTPTQNVESKTNLMQLLMAQDQTLMLVSADTPYAAQVIDPARADNAKVSFPLHTTPIGVLAGLMLGFIAAAILYRRKMPLRTLWGRDHSRDREKLAPVMRS